jgi:homocysteine S-methyltransferase
LIYDVKAANVLEKTHREYLDVGQRYGLAMFALTDTWRASQERIRRSAFPHRKVNQDNAAFIDAMRRSYNRGGSSPIYVGGLLGPKGDAYKPSEAPPRQEAEKYHTPQIEALAESAVDFLYASTLPAFPEARGMASAMAKAGVPYILSFVVRPEGRLLDGTPLEELVREMDSMERPPAGYAINCVHPRVFREALVALAERDNSALPRFVSFQANTSSKRPEELDGLEQLDTEEPESLADWMVRVQKEFGTPFMGGCCGTNTVHIEWLAKKHIST